MVFQPDIDQQLQVPAEVIATDKAADLAILKVDLVTKPVTLLDKVRVPFGSSCGLFGHPLSEVRNNFVHVYTRAAGGVVSRVTLMRRYHDTEPVGMYELDIFAHGGNSGGPVFLRSGYVFGVLSAHYLIPDESGQLFRGNLNYATDIQEAILLAQEVDVTLKLRDHI